MMTIRPHHPLRAVVSLLSAMVIFAVFAAVLPATSAAQPGLGTAVDVTHGGPPPPPPPPPDCATPWPSNGNHRKVFDAIQRDAEAGYEYDHDNQTFDNDEIVNFDAAHPESLEQRSIITDAVYRDLWDADGGSPRTVYSTFGMTTKSYQHLDDGQAPHDGQSSAELYFEQMVTVVGDNAFVRFDSSLLQTDFDYGSAFATDPLAVFYIQRFTGDGGDVVHASSIFDHEFVGNWPGTNATIRTIDVPLEPEQYIIGVYMKSGVDADGPGLSRGVNYLDLFASWGVGCDQPAPLPAPVPLPGIRSRDSIRAVPTLVG